MSTLADRLAKGPASKQCALIRNIKEHPDYVAILAAVDDDEWGHKELARELAELGVNADQVRRHRTAECACV